MANYSWTWGVIPRSMLPILLLEHNARSIEPCFIRVRFQYIPCDAYFWRGLGVSTSDSCTAGDFEAVAGDVGRQG